MIKVKNETIAKNIRYCKTNLSRFIGLRFSKLHDNQAIIFINERESKLNSIIDMFFVFNPLDILWLNKEKEVIDIKINAKPFTINMPKKKAKYIIELKKNKAENIELGDKISFNIS